jgi:hypothetical protein
MALISVNGSTEYWIPSGIRPCFIYIKTSDNLDTVMTTGYLNEDESLTYSNELMAIVEVTEGLVMLQVSVSGGNTSLIAPVTL